MAPSFQIFPLGPLTARADMFSPTAALVGYFGDGLAKLDDVLAAIQGKSVAFLMSAWNWDGKYPLLVFDGTKPMALANNLTVRDITEGETVYLLVEKGNPLGVSGWDYVWGRERDNDYRLNFTAASDFDRATQLLQDSLQYTPLWEGIPPEVKATQPYAALNFLPADTDEGLVRLLVNRVLVEPDYLTKLSQQTILPWDTAEKIVAYLYLLAAVAQSPRALELLKANNYYREIVENSTYLLSQPVIKQVLFRQMPDLFTLVEGTETAVPDVEITVNRSALVQGLPFVTHINPDYDGTISLDYSSETPEIQTDVRLPQLSVNVNESIVRQIYPDRKFSFSERVRGEWPINPFFLITARGAPYEWKIAKPARVNYSLEKTFYTPRPLWRGYALVDLPTANRWGPYHRLAAAIPSRVDYFSIVDVEMPDGEMTVNGYLTELAHFLFSHIS